MPLRICIPGHGVVEQVKGDLFRPVRFGATTPPAFDPSDPSTWTADSAILALRDQLQASAADETFSPQNLKGTDIQLAAEQAAKDIAADVSASCDVYCNPITNADGSTSPTDQEQALSDLQALGTADTLPVNTLAATLYGVYEQLIHEETSLTSAITAIDAAFQAHQTQSGGYDLPTLSAPWWVYAGGILFGLVLVRDILREL